LRVAGLTFMPFSSRNLVTPVGSICTGTEPQSHHPLGMSVPATGGPGRQPTSSHDAVARQQPGHREQGVTTSPDSGDVPPRHCA
jgi:hypothetical protein